MPSIQQRYEIMPFHSTVMGGRFFNGQFPALIENLERLNKNLEKIIDRGNLREVLEEALNDGLNLDNEEKEALLNKLMETLNKCGYTTTPTKKESH